MPTKRRPARKTSASRRPKAAKHRYTVVVGNVGTVYDGGNKAAARKEYADYVQISLSGQGRAGGVTLFQDEEIVAEHAGVDF